MLPALAAPAVVNVAVTREDVADGAAGRPSALGVAPAQALEDLARSPAEATVLLEDEVDDLSGCLMRDEARRSAAVEQPAWPFMPVALEPFVPGVAADAVAQAQLAHRPLATLEILREMVSFEHRVGLLPGHRLSFHRGRRSVNHVPGHLSSMCPGCTSAKANMCFQATVGVGLAADRERPRSPTA